MQQLAVTIGMPVYNGANFLPVAIASLRAQDSDAIARIVVSDNASTDETPAILSDWASQDSRVQVFRQPVNRGPVANFNFVAAQAATPLFMFAAYDDAWSPNYVRDLGAVMAAQPKALLGVPRNVFMSEDFTTETGTIPSETISGRSRAVYIRKVLRQARSGWFYGMHRTSALVPCLGANYTSAHPWGNEWVAMLPLFLAGEVAACDQAIYYQRSTGVSVSHWRPRTAAQQFALNMAMRKFAYSALREADLTWAQRAYLSPFINKYVGRHTFKLRHVAADWMAEAVGRTR